MTPAVSRTKGKCSVCDRGRPRARPVVLVRLQMPRKYLTKEQMSDGWRYVGNAWLGLCLMCAKAVAKKVSR